MYDSLKVDKITIINDQNPITGTSSYVYGIYENLTNNKVPTDFFQFMVSTKKPENEKIRIKHGILHIFDDGNKVIYNSKLAINFLLGFNWRYFKDMKPNIAVLSGPSLLPLTKYYKNTIAIGHDLYFLNKNNNSILLTKYMKKMYNYYKDASYVIVNSNFTRNEFVTKLGLNEEKISTVYPYVNFDVFHPGSSRIRSLLNLSEDDILLLSIGGDNPNKNIETILKLMTILPRNFKLIRVGRNFNTLGLINEMNLSKRVITLGNVDQELIAELYRGSDIFIFPSLYEGFGIPLIEAMASGIPFITSNRGSLPEVAGDSGIVCDPFDFEYMANEIFQIMQDDKLKGEIVKGNARAKIFSAEKQYESLLKCITMFD